MNDDLYVDGILVYRNDVVVLRSPLYPPKKDVVRKKERGCVMEFTVSSRRRLAFVAANTDVVFLTMITLTYPRVWETDGKTVKRHLRAFLQYLRRIDEGVSYLWFLEFQRRGAPHFHVLVDTPSHVYDNTAVSKRWAEIASGGDVDHIRAGTRVERLRSRVGGVRYAVKYAWKMRQKRVPHEYKDVGRFWGHSKSVKPKLINKHSIRSDWELKLYLLRWLRDNRSRSTKYRILLGATDYLSKSTGLTYELDSV